MKSFLALLLVTPMLAQTPLKYPETRKSEVVEDYFGKKIADPYRWLEDDNSPETKTWVEAQNKVSFGFLEQIHQRPALRELKMVCDDSVGIRLGVGACARQRDKYDHGSYRQTDTTFMQHHRASQIMTDISCRSDCQRKSVNVSVETQWLMRRLPSNF